MIFQVYWKKIGKKLGKTRKPFFVLSPSISAALVENQATTLDIAPTMLSFLNWDIDAFALGRNLVKLQPTLIEEYGQDDFFKMVQ